MFQDLIDGLVILALFFVRLGVPVILTLGIGIWLEKRLRPAETQSERKPTRRGTIIPFPRGAQNARASLTAATHCWDVKQCDAATRAQCAAYQRPDLPCWLALQATGGRVRAECADCEMYARPQRAVR